MNSAVVSIAAVLAAASLGACDGSPTEPDVADAALPDAQVPSQPDAGVDAPDQCGQPCGECDAGRYVCSGDELECQYPGPAFDPVNGLPPADTGEREVFFTEDFAGTPEQRIRAAGEAAAAVGGAVVIERIYEVERQVRFYQGVMYTGGGLRRRCTPVGVVTAPAPATDSCVAVDTTEGFSVGTHLQVVVHEGYDGRIGSFSLSSIDIESSRVCAAESLGFAIPEGAKVIRVHNLAGAAEIYSSGLVIDSVVFDGAERCNSETHDWRYNNTIAMRGTNVVRNSYFVDTPSENLTTCGALVADNVALELEGSFVHKSCAMSPPPVDILVGNYVKQANRAGDDLMDHSEGLVTFSANGGNLVSTSNTFRYGSEGVYGLAGPDDQNVSAVADCYAHFPRLIRLYGGANPDAFIFEDVELIDVEMNPVRQVPLGPENHDHQ